MGLQRENVTVGVVAVDGFWLAVQLTAAALSPVVSAVPAVCHRPSASRSVPSVKTVAMRR